MEAHAPGGVWPGRAWSGLPELVPGSAPAVWLHGWREAWSIGAGTSGVFVAREVRRVGGTAFRVQLGWMRAGIPWSGVTIRSPWEYKPVGFSESPLWDRRP